MKTMTPIGAMPSMALVRYALVGAKIGVAQKGDANAIQKFFIAYSRKDTVPLNDSYTILS